MSTPSMRHWRAANSTAAAAGVHGDSPQTPASARGSDSTTARTSSVIAAYQRNVTCAAGRNVPACSAA